MNNGSMSESNIVFKHHGLAACLMYACIVLYVHTVSHSHTVNIGANHSRKPHTTVIAHCNVAYERCVL